MRNEGTYSINISIILFALVVYLISVIILENFVSHGSGVGLLNFKCSSTATTSIHLFIAFDIKSSNKPLIDKGGVPIIKMEI